MKERITLGRTAVFNPLAQIESSPVLSSESSCHNDYPGVCPKCSSLMSTAALATNDMVYWCSSCHVALPMPD